MISPRRSGRLPLAFLAALGAAILTGCQAGRTYVLTPPPAGLNFATVGIRASGGPNEPIGPEKRSEFEAALRQRLEPLGVRPDGALVLNYRFVFYDSGSAPARVGALFVNLVGVPTGSMGNGTVAVEATFTDTSGAEVARIVADGPIDGPFGSTNGGLETAAASIAEFTKASFHSPAREPAPVPVALRGDR